MGETQYPIWWDWELEFTSHLEKRMIDRNLSEIDLRTMFDNVYDIENDAIEGRWQKKTKHLTEEWIIIVEPDFEEKTIVVITAYPFYEGFNEVNLFRSYIQEG